MGYQSKKNWINNAKDRLKKIIKNDPLKKVQDELDYCYNGGTDVTEEGQKLVARIRKEHDAEIEGVKDKANKRFAEINLKYAQMELEAIKSNAIEKLST